MLYIRIRIVMVEFFVVCGLLFLFNNFRNFEVWNRSCEGRKKDVFVIWKSWERIISVDYD